MICQRFPGRCLSIAACLLLATGCRALSNVPLLRGLAPEKPVPPEIVARYGPTAGQRIQEVDRLGKAARKASPDRQQIIAETLAQQIREEKVPTVRLHIVNAIQNCRTPMASSVLRAALDDEDIDVRIAACKAWGKVGGPEAVELLGRTVGDDGAELEVRLAATSALANVKHPRAVQALGLAIQDRQDPALQYRAAQSLQQVTGVRHGNNLVAWRNYVSEQGDPFVARYEAIPQPSNALPNQGGERAFLR